MHFTSDLYAKAKKAGCIKLNRIVQSIYYESRLAHNHYDKSEFIIPSGKDRVGIALSGMNDLVKITKLIKMEET